MSSSRIDVYLHFVWQTKCGRRTLTGEVEYFVHRHIRQEADKLGLYTIAVNSAWDHTHALFGWNTETTLSEATRQFKGASSYLWNHRGRDPETQAKLEWQSGFGAFSIRRSEITEVQRYIDLQKHHHNEGKLWWRFERPFWREEKYDDAFLLDSLEGTTTDRALCNIDEGRRCVSVLER